MARDCHKCNRPNNDRAKRCIYCGTELAPLAVTPAPAPRAPAGATSSEEKARPEVFLAVVSPRQELSLEARQALGVELNLDPFTVSQKLLSPAPWVARSFPEAEPSQRFTRRLIEIGLDAYLLKQSGVDVVSRFVPAAGLLELRDDGVTLTDAKGRELPIIGRELFLIVRGRIQEKRERGDDPTQAEAPVKMGRMALGSHESPREEPRGLRGVIAGFKWSPRPGLMRNSFSGQAVEIMDLYLRGKNHAVRVTESEFDYRGLGERMSPSGLLNFNLIFNAITATAPDCPVDSSFNTVGYTLRDTPREDKVRDQLTLSLGVSESMKRIVDNRAFFNDFSARLFLHYLRESKKK